MKKSLMTLILGLAVAIFSYNNITLANNTGGHMMAGHAGHEMEMTPVDNFKKAVNPKYPVGTKVIITTDHMEGMLGAKAVVSGVFDTTVYAVDYISTDTGEKITNHKWIVKEEIQKSKNKTYKVGDKVKLGSGHMSSMGGENVIATIVQVVKGPVYMVDVYPTDGSPVMKNHQWVVESEMKTTN